MYHFFWFNLLVATNGLLLLLLAANVSRLRLKHQVSYGDADNKAIMQAIRVHANGTEQVPIFCLITLALVFSGISDNILATLVIIFTSSRILHLYGMLGKKPIARQAGAGMSYLSQGVSLVILLANFG